MKELIIISGAAGSRKTYFAKSTCPRDTVEFSSFKKYLKEKNGSEKSILIDVATIKDFTLLKKFMSEQPFLKEIKFTLVTNLDVTNYFDFDRAKNKFDSVKHVRITNF